MPPTRDPARDLLFGLLALQAGLINQAQLVAAFHAWTQARDRPMAEILAAQDALQTPCLTLLEGLVIEHLRRHGSDPERSLAALGVGRSTRECLAAIGDTELEASLAQVGSVKPELDDDPDRTASYAVGEATSDGQRFRVLRPHARGGLGAVFVALDTELHREVALKQILDSYSDDEASRRRFLVEAEITGNLEHPGIVPVYGLGTYGDGRPYYAMRFIRGESLKEAIDRFHADAGLRIDPGKRSLEVRKLLRRFTDVCNAIDYAHSRGVLHRDIKPGNVIVGRHGETLVVDWGLAKATGRPAPPSGEQTLRPASGSAETLPGSALGTPGYMSPEQAEGDLERLGPRSDVYSLGATLYCLLTGRPPFVGDAVDVIPRVQRGDFPRPRAIDPAIDRALEAVCLKAMAARPDDRYPSPRALAEDVERWMADETVAAWREPWTRTLVRWLTRHRTGVTAAGAALLAGVVGLGAVLGMQAQANVQLRRANADLALANDRVIQANVDLKAANERERQQFDLAMEAIRLFHGEVSSDLLLKGKQFEALRTKLLRGAADFYGKLEGLLRGQEDPASRAALGRAYEELGELMSQIGDKPETLAVHGKALAVRRELASRSGADAGAALAVARDLIAAGRLRDETGDVAGALSSYAEARSLLYGLNGPGADRDAIRGEVARCDYWTAVCYHTSGRRREALAAYERARATAADLAASHPGVLDHQRLLAWCDNDAGILLQFEGRTSEALEAYLRSGRTKQVIADAYPGDLEFRGDLAIAFNNIGNLLLVTGRTAKALTALDRGRAIRQGLADDYPAVTQFQSELASSLCEVGDALRLVGRTAEVRALYERALAILDGLIGANPTLTRERSRLIQGLRGLGAAQLAAGQTAEAMATWRRAATIGDGLRSDNAETLYYLAGCHARLGGVAGAAGSGLSAAEGPTELDRAMAILRRSVAAGYRDGTSMRRDPDLDPLRSRSDFQLLMMDLAWPVDPFAHSE